MEHTNKEYLEYLNKKSPDSTLAKDMAFAFLVGGAICVIGQALFDLYTKLMLMDTELARSAVSMTMVFLGAFLTGINVYGKIAKYAGAGTLVPITGFANAIVSPAMEFKKEGLVLGLAAKMFVIAGPVLVYGITSSAIIGVLYWLMMML